MNPAQFTGISAFGRAYRIMLENDTHAVDSVDRELFRTIVRLCLETADHLYGPFTPLVTPYQLGSRPELESILSSICPRESESETLLAAIIDFTRGLGTDAEQDLNRVVTGGTEEQIIRRSSDWCTDIARVACVLCQIAGFPARIVYLFNLDQAYSAHVIVEVFREGEWGALDSSTGIVYKTHNGRPASAWELMNNPSLVEAHRKDPRAFYTTVGQFQAIGIANYFCWQVNQYNYSTSGLNEYYFSILRMSNKGWPGGLRWLHGEDTEDAEPRAVAELHR